MTTADILSAEHRQMLERGSGIRADVVSIRGYRTVTQKADLRRLGFSDRQTRVPALLIPVWGVTGEIVLYQLRPDTPRVLQNKAVKYETPAHSRMAIDVHPLVRRMLGDPTIPLWLTEGIKKGDALVSRGCCALALLGVWNWRGTNDRGGRIALADWECIALNGRLVYIVFDSDVMLKPEVHAALIRLTSFLQSRGAKVGLVYLPGRPGGVKQGVDDFLASGGTIDDLVTLVTSEPKGVSGDSSVHVNDKTSPADRAIAYALEKGAEPFCDQFNEPHISFENPSGHRENWPLKSKSANGFIRWVFYNTEGRGLSGEALSTARSTLAAKAQFQGKLRPLSLRVASTEEGVWYDLGDWRAVLISEAGWSVVDKPPVIFRHYSHRVPQSTPERGGTLEPFLDLLNLPDEHSRLLLKVYLVASLLPDVSLPVLAVRGEQGSAKSTLFRLLRALIDPSNLQALAPPETLREFVQIASHHRTVYLDNLTHLPDWLSDALCRLCTGEGFSKRELYTDDDDVIYEIRGLGGINGINMVGTKPDLLDRALIIKLLPIPPEKRCPEQVLWERFQTIRGYVLGAMFETLFKAMGRHRNMKPSYKLPRLADFALWGADIAEALGYTAEEFLQAYGVNIDSQNEAAIEESPVAQGILAFLEANKELKGTATDLLATLERNAVELHINTKSKDWPKAPNVLSRRLHEAMSNLRRMGIGISETTGGGITKWRFSRQAQENIAPIGITAPLEAILNEDCLQKVSAPGTPASAPQGAVSLPAEAPNRYENSDGNDSGDMSPNFTETPARDSGQDCGEV